ncbi:hypothetical protein V1511DRAFT_459030 [Dipodascopsis uninucleata]
MPSLFLAIYAAIYPYTAQTAQELSLAEGDVLYILEKSSDDDWWKAKKRMVGQEEEEPVGLVPNNYIEPMKISGRVRALYDYDRQTDEEISFKEDDLLDVYDTSDPDWVLVGLKDEYGFAPSNYIEYISDEAAALHAESQNQQQQYYHEPESGQAQQLQAATYYPDEAAEENTNDIERQPSMHTSDTGVDEEEEESAPQLPSRPRPASSNAHESSSRRSGFLKWDVQEVDSKRKKYKATLAIGNGSILFSPERASSSPQQWSITNLLNYNSEKKHVFLEFEHPSMSLDLHVGSKETAAEIIAAIGELVGAKKASGLREVIEASVPIGQKFGKALYDFDAQGDDEVSIRAGDDVFILDDKKSDEWWMIRHAVTLKEGVVPSSYIEVSKKPSKPKREHSERTESNHRRKASSPPPSTPAKPKPDPSKIRTWTDRTGTFKVDAALVGCSDGKIQLHKVNGVKIAVAASKMSVEDLEYVERITGVNLDSAKPEASGATRVARTTTVPVSDFDWFEFFLSCGVDVNNCQRYAVSFQKDQMDESVLPDITPSIMRMLGLKEGDILRISKVVNEKYKKKRSVSFDVSSTGGDGQDDQDDGSLFAGPGGVLKNNTRKSRPAPTVTTPSAVDGSVFSGSRANEDQKKESKPPSPIKEDPGRQIQQLTGAMKDLSAISPLEPSPASGATPVLSPPVASTQTTGSVNFSQQLSPAITGQPAQAQAQYVPMQTHQIVPSQATGMNLPVSYPQLQSQQPQVTGFMGQSLSATGSGPSALQQQLYGIQRPQPPQQSQGSGINTSLPPPPQVSRPLSTGSVPAAFGPQPTGFSTLPTGFTAQPTGLQPGIGQFSAPLGFQAQVTGYPNQFPGVMGLQPQHTISRQFTPQSQFGIQQMQTGFQGQFNNGFSGNQGLNNYATPPASLQVQPTGLGFGNGPSSGPGFNSSYITTANNSSINGSNANSATQGVNANLIKPLVPTKTGPPPKVTFGVNQPADSNSNAAKRANLAAATPDNPFGF